MIRCANFSIPEYPKFDAYLKKQLTDGSIDYTTLISFIKDDIFKNIVINENIDIETMPNKAFEALIKTAAIRTNDVNLMSKADKLTKNYDYLTIKAKNDAINLLIGKINGVIIEDLMNGVSSQPLHKILDIVADIIIEDYLYPVISKIVKNPEAKAEFDKLFARNNVSSGDNIRKFFDRFSKIRTKIEFDDRGKLDKIISFISKHGTAKDYNLAKTVVNLTNPEFINKLKLRKNLLDYDEKHTVDYTQEDLGDKMDVEYLVDEVYFDNDEEEGEIKDLMSKNWSHSIGETKNWKDHMSVFCKFYINSLLKVRNISYSSKTNSYEYDYDTDNELGVEMYDNGEYLAKLLYTIPNVVNLDTFLEGILHLAKTNPKAKSLIQLYNELKDNTHFAYAFMKDFNLYVTTKSEAIVESDSKDNITLEARRTNKNANVRDIVNERLLNAIKNVIVNEEVDKADYAYNVYKANPTNKEALFRAVKTIIKDLTKEEFESLVANKPNNTTELTRLGQIGSSLSGLITTLKNGRGIYNDWKAKRSLPDSFIRNEDRRLIYAFVDIVGNSFNTNIRLTSRNSLGKQSSDVIDRNYLNVIADIIQSDSSRYSTASSYARQKFASTQYIYSNLLVSRPRANYGLFQKVGNSYVLNDYAKDMFNITLISGMVNQNSQKGQTYNRMFDSEYLALALSYFASNLDRRTYTNQAKDTKGNPIEIPVANYILPVPSDAPKNFTISGPRYKVNLFNEALPITYDRINKNSAMFNLLMNIAKQEIVNMYAAANKLFAFEGGVLVESELLKNNPDAFYDTYHYVTKKDGTKEFYTKVGNHIIPSGEVFKFKRLSDTSVTTDYFSELVGFGKPIDILYGVSEDSKFGVSVVNGELILTDIQKEALETAVAKFATDMYTNAVKYLTTEYANTIGGYPTDTIIEFYFNDFIMRDAVNDIFAGDLHFYKDPQNVLKRIKHVQGSGKPFGNIDYTLNAFSPTRQLMDIGVSVPYVDSAGNRKLKKVNLETHFNGITINNSVTPARPEVIENITNLLKESGATQEDIDRILKPYLKPAATNDAQSWITLEEWIRRITAAGEFSKYEDLIRKLVDPNIPLTDLSKEELANFVQIQKNFYFDLYYDPIMEMEVPRQIKNAEFVLIPKLIQGTELEQVYNIMVEHNIHQLNTVETTKVAKHQMLTLWDDKGVANIEQFKKDLQNLIANKGVDRFTYNHLYRQQEVPQHMLDSKNKAGIQIMKKILDNLDYSKYPELEVYVKEIFENYCANIEDNFVQVCTELGIELNKHGEIVIDENGNIKLDKEIFLERFKENAARQEADSATLEHFEVDEHGETLLPLFISSIGNKMESIANSYFNANITKQLINGWHAAQLSDFGFKKLGSKDTISTSKNLRYKVKETVVEGYDENGKPITKDIVYSEIYLPRWAKELANVNLNDWYALINKENPTEEELKTIALLKEVLTMIGYRIPTEGKQSVLTMRVVPFPGSEDGFLPTEYGSTVVVPHEFVHQTGADFDIDSVYAMIKSFVFNKNGLPIVHSVRQYDETIEGYLKYLRGNTDKAGRKNLKNYFGKGDNLNEVITQRKNGFDVKVTRAVKNTKDLDAIAKEYGLMTYEQYCMATSYKRASKAARSNDIVENFIRILSHPGAYEENAMVSGFEDLKEANNYWANLAGDTKAIVAPNGFITQLKWQNAATSGIKLKGISVNMDTLASICNVTRAYHKKGIVVAYPKEKYNLEVLKARFGEVRETNDAYIVTHKQIAWSGDNKNIDGYLVAPYSSQTTAHILDVMKEGSVHNENSYTFNAFKAMTLLGSNFDTAIGFMWQPGLDAIVKIWKDSNSVTNFGRTNIIQTAIRKFAVELGIAESATHVPDVELLSKIDKKFGATEESPNEMAMRFLGVSRLTTAFMHGGCIFDREIYRKRLAGELSALENSFVDLCTVIQFVELNAIGADMSNNVNAIKADKYGAKSTFFETEKVFRDIKTCIETSDIYSGDEKLVLAIFPGFSEKYDEFIHSDVSASKYRSLAYFLKYSTATSIKVCEQIFETATKEFLSYCYNYASLNSHNTLTFDQYKAIKNYVLRSIITARTNINFLNLPTTIVDGEWAMIPGVEVDTQIAQEFEIKRLSGYTHGTIKFSCNDVHNLTLDEIKTFAKLTPVEKFSFIRDNFTGLEYFNIIETSAYDERSNKRNKFLQFLRYNQGNYSTDEVHAMFDEMFTHPNPLIRLTALDCVKYAFIIEGASFRPTNVRNSISNLPLYDSSTGGLGLATSLKNGIKNISFSTQDVINFVRCNPYAFSIPTYNGKTLKSLGVEFNKNTDGSYSILNNKVFSVKSHPKFIRINHVIYVSNIYQFGDHYIDGNLREHLAYIPLSPLEEYEVHAGVDNSLFHFNNTVKPYRTFAWATTNRRYVRDKAYAYISSNIVEGVKKELLKVTMQPFGDKFDLYNSFMTPMFKQKVEHNRIYVLPHDQAPDYYIGITGEKAIAMSKDLAELREKYKTAKLNDFAILVRMTGPIFEEFKARINNNEVIEEITPEIVYSAAADMSEVTTSDIQLARANRETLVYIADEAKTNDEFCQRILNKFKTINVDIKDIGSISANSDFANILIENYISNEGAFIYDSINNFPLPDGTTVRIDDKRVLEAIKNNPLLEDYFLKVLLKAATFKDKYRLYDHINLNSLDAKSAKIVEAINKVVRDIDTNNMVHSVLREWMMDFADRYTTNPMLKENLANVFTSYGDTSFTDLWFQDIHFNKDPMVQLIIGEFENRLEAARRRGNEEAAKFKKTIQKIINEAAPRGGIASIASVVDDKARVIRKHTEEWEADLADLRDAVEIEKAVYGENSVEHLRAKYDYEKFLCDTTVHKLKDAVIIKEDGEHKINYERTRLMYDDVLLNKRGDIVAKVFSEYKQILAEIGRIYNNSPSNVMSKEDEERVGELMGKIYDILSVNNDDGSKKDGDYQTAAILIQKYDDNIKFLRKLFFDTTVAPGFEEKLKKNLEVIRRYETQRDKEGNLLINREELMKIPEYYDAKLWIRNNAKAINTKIIDLSTIYELTGEQYRKKSKSTVYINQYGARDEFGIVDGRLIPEDKIGEIKEQTVSMFKSHQLNGMPYGGIIRATPAPNVVLTKYFYQQLNSGRVAQEDEVKYGEAINEILEKYWDYETRELRTWQIPIEELLGVPPGETDPNKKTKLGLIDYFEAIDALKIPSGPNGRKVAEFIENECDVDYNWTTFNADETQAKATKGYTYYEAWKKVFTVTDEDGITKPRSVIYGTILPKGALTGDASNLFVDYDTTSAKQELEAYYRDVETPYYWLKRREVIEANKDTGGANSPEYKKWFINNHYWNPYERRYKPLRIWTTKEANVAITNDPNVKWEPRANNMVYGAKKELLNEDYAKSGIAKYKLGTGYDNDAYTSLNEYQRRIIEEIEKILNKFVITNSNQRYIDEGFLPSIAQGKELSVLDIPKETAKFFGYWGRKADNLSFKTDDEVTFEKDYDIPNQSLVQLRTSESLELMEVPRVKREDETDEEFIRRKKEVLKHNREARKKNVEVHSSLVNTNWDEVLDAFIKTSSREYAIAINKNLLYALDNMLRNYDVYDTSSGSLRLDKKRSSQSAKEYRTTKRINTAAQNKEYIRRQVFQQFKNPNHNTLNVIGNLAQNITGSKYMMMNITGGIANVLTGSANIFMERMAGEYVNIADWEAGKMEWLKGSISFAANMYSDKSTTLQDAIIKDAKIIDFDRLVELESSGANKYINRIKGLTYSPQTIGEHYMQSTMLFAMMKSHRIININGEDRVVSFDMYMREVESNIFNAILAENPELKADWETFNKIVNNDSVLNTEYVTYKRNKIYDFVTKHFDKDLQKRYVKERKEAVKNLRTEFETKGKTVYEQFELVDGVAVIKPDSKLTHEMYAKFINKVRLVNKKVHGVYDKIGAARLEQLWYGGMVMQYHKHLYPGFKKRYRWNPYYNETLESIEKGSYTSLIQFLATPFTRDNGKSDDFNEACNGIKNIVSNLVNFYFNIGLEYNLLPEFEKANIRRNAADLLYVVAAVCGAIAICGLGGDDDDDILYHLALYQADRLASEAASFTPWGIYGEGKKLWSSPVAFQQTFNDAVKTLNLTLGLFLDDNFTDEYTTGRYKGLSKFEVILIRNTPILRTIDRIIQMPKHNSYYKLQENALGFVDYKAVAEKLFD